MEPIPPGITLDLDQFPPRVEILREIFCLIEESRLPRVYLIPGHQFCWSIDPGLRVPDAYPEAFFLGLVQRCEARNIELIPGLALDLFFEFLDLHPTTDRLVAPPEGSLQREAAAAIIEKLLEDLTSVIPASRVALLDTVESAERTRGADCGENESLRSCFESAAAGLGLQLVPIRLEGAVHPGLEEAPLRDEELTRLVRTAVQRPRDGLPPPPEWLSLLPAERTSAVREFLAVYGELDRLLGCLWQRLRRAWEGHGGIHEFEELSGALVRAGDRFESTGRELVLPPWLARQRRAWERGVFSPLLHYGVCAYREHGGIDLINATIRPIGAKGSRK